MTPSILDFMIMGKGDTAVISTWTKFMIHFPSVRPELVEGLSMVRQAHQEWVIRT